MGHLLTWMPSEKTGNYIRRNRRDKKVKWERSRESISPVSLFFFFFDSGVVSKANDNISITQTLH